ncbi:MAG: hypothetical protein HY751_08830 [Nitrospinae bacterium]|nr:hypothetical protein [Nitrospinota bacterium]
MKRNIKVKARRDSAEKKLVQVIEGTIIHQRQRELSPGRWDMAVFGPSRDGKEAVLRVCVAEHMLIQKAPAYLAAVGDPEMVGYSGMMPIEELAGGDLPEDLMGLDIYHMAPLRPLNIIERRVAPGLAAMRDMAMEEFGGKNIAIIETPDEAAWSLSAIKYLNELDEAFPDPLMSAIRSTMRDTSLDFSAPGRYLH